MSRPPRVPVLIPESQPLIYFLTLCAANRRKVLANPEVFGAAKLTIVGLDRWRVWAWVLMPDHVHFLVSPPCREISVADFSTLFKRGLNRRLSGSIQWQEGCFDHLLRSHESGMQKWEYMRENPVRAGLVTCWMDWPYQQGM